MKEENTTNTNTVVSDKISPESAPTSETKQDDNDMSATTVSEPLLAKRKRGRPKKNSNVDEVVIMSSSRSAPNSTETKKRSRGRPKGSTAKPSLGCFGFEQSKKCISAHYYTVLPGEDIVRRIMSISQSSSRSMCILSAIGQVSTATMRRGSGEYYKYEGLFQIISLTGTFVTVKIAEFKRKTSKLCVSLCRNDGKIFGGASIASLIAADHVQLLLGSFKQDKNNQPIIKRTDPTKPEDLKLGPDDLIGAPIETAPTFSDDVTPLTDDDDDVIYDVDPISVCFPVDPTTTLPNQRPSVPAI